MSVNAVTATSSSTSTGTTSKSSSTTTTADVGGLGESDFMTLLLAQLKNQDPLKPMEDKDFIAQLAQFNSLSQLTEMNKAIKEMNSSQNLAEGSALIGKTVSGLADDGSMVTGLVSGWHLVSSKVILDVDGKSLPLEALKSAQS